MFVDIVLWVAFAIGLVVFGLAPSKHPKVFIPGALLAIISLGINTIR